VDSPSGGDFNHLNGGYSRGGMIGSLTDKPITYKYSIFQAEVLIRPLPKFLDRRGASYGIECECVRLDTSPSV